MLIGAKSVLDGDPRRPLGSGTPPSCVAVAHGMRQGMGQRSFGLVEGSEQEGAVIAGAVVVERPCRVAKAR